MPVYSMTGYASATAGARTTSETGTIAESPSPRPAGAATSVTVELRSVNGRFLDLNFRMPDEFRSLEPARRALDGLTDARAREGARLVRVLMERVQRLRELAAGAEPLVPAVVQRQQQKFIERWQEALEAVGAAQSVPREALQDRAINEAAAYAIRIDVAEELARLRAHLDEIERLLNKGGEVGKRLDFLIQELLREANTLGSKASTLELTNISVEMKVAIEQLREQVQNLE